MRKWDKYKEFKKRKQALNLINATHKRGEYRRIKRGFKQIAIQYQPSSNGLHTDRALKLGKQYSLIN